MPSEHPILFTGDEVRAILEDRKTQTRPVVKVKIPPCVVGYPSFANGEWGIYLNRLGGGPYKHIGSCPYGQPGDLLYWANEPIEFIGINSLPGAWRQVGVILSLFDGSRREVPIPDVDNLLNGRKVKRPVLGRWRGWRLPIEWARDWRWPITDVRVQRVQEISPAGCKAEGVQKQLTGTSAQLRTDFHDLWNSINTRRGYGWDVNPWVWVVAFKRKED